MRKGKKRTIAVLCIVVAASCLLSIVLVSSLIGSRSIVDDAAAAMPTSTPTPTPTQKPAQIATGCYTLTLASDASKSIGISNASEECGAHLQVQDSADTNAQKFYITAVQNGWYRIESVSSGKELDVTGWNRSEGAGIQQWDYTKDDNQLWKLVILADGSYSFESRCSGLYIDSGTGNLGADVTCGSGGVATSQAFVLTSVDVDQATSSPSRAGYTKTASTTNQIVLVEATGSSATVSFSERDSEGVWKVKHAVDGYVGTQGVGQASEGASITPVGSFDMPFAFGIQQSSASLLPYHQITSQSVWVDDSTSECYNTWQESSEYSGEVLSSAKEAYRYAIVIGYNGPGYLGTRRNGCIPGEGSAIFLHCSEDKPTQGCVSVPADSMAYLLQHVSTNSQIVIGTPDTIYGY